MRYPPQLDFISDTVTVPDAEMIASLQKITFGDLGYEEDEATNQLESYIASLFNKEDACFVLSGTASNLIAINLISSFASSVITGNQSDLYLWESSSVSSFGGLRLEPVNTSSGMISLEDPFWDQVNNSFFGQRAKPSSVVIEDPHIGSGGLLLGQRYLKKLFTRCCDVGLNLHIDGARILNPIFLGIYDPVEIGGSCTTISCCFSKTIGAPMGSIIAGTKEDISKARQIRKLIGGTVRQSGVIAAMCLNALSRGKESVTHSVHIANELYLILKEHGFQDIVKPNHSNIILFKAPQGNDFLIKHFASFGIRIAELEAGTIRIVCHRQHNEESLLRFKEALISV